MESLRLAACGIDCSKCASYLVTMNRDVKAAEMLVEWYRGQKWIMEDEGAEEIINKAPLCKGCWNSDAKCFFKCRCGELDFRICCNSKSISHCGECDVFPCTYYLEFASVNIAHINAMDYLESIRNSNKEGE